MTERDSAADLDFWSGRARGGSVGQDPEPPRKPYRSSWSGRFAARLPALRVPARPTLRLPRGGARPTAAAALLAGLTIAWLVVGHQAHGSAVTAASPATTDIPTVATTAASTSVPAPPPGAISTAGLRTDRCAELSAAQPHVLCIVDGVIMEVALYTRDSVGAAFRRIAGAPVPPRSGPPECAADRPDERAWSLASAPLNAVGRYVCRVEGTRAGIWWTYGDRLLHAEAGSAHDADLAKLFSWWRAHPSA
jgi:hypothetical protein